MTTENSLDLLGYNFIGGERRADKGVVLESRDAVTGESLPWRFAQASTAEVAAAAAAASEAFPVFRALSNELRAVFLDTIAEELDALDERFVALVGRETALPPARVQGELARTSNQMRLFAKVLRRGDFYGARIDTAQPDRKPMPKLDIRQYKTGLGPVAVFGASNFPLAFSTAGGDTASALAAGCPVVVKAHRGHMATSEGVALAIMKAVERCALPKGVFNMIYGDGVGRDLVQHPEIRAVGFTGSLHGGRAICDLAAARAEPIPVFAEMSSINPIVMLPNALANKADEMAEGLTFSITNSVGQLCTKPGVVIGIKSPEFSAYLDKLGACLSAKAAQTMLNADTLKSYCQGLAKLEAHPDVTPLAKGGSDDSQAQAVLYRADARLLLESEPVLLEEVFGPACVVVEVETREALFAGLSAMRGQLTGTLMADGEDLKAYSDLLPLLEEKVGRVLLNGYPTGVEVCDSMVHGGPYPATSDARGTSVGTLAIERFLRPICYQNYPDSVLPPALQDGNPLGLLRLVDGEMTREAVTR